MSNTWDTVLEMVFIRPCDNGIINLLLFFLQPLTCHFCCHVPVLFVLNVAVLILLFVFAMASAS
jgi:hypothetical protein